MALTSIRISRNGIERKYTMNESTKQRLRDILKNLNSLDYVEPSAIPGIDLYMDQVTTFMDGELASNKRYADDKLLTKTMINNYAKNDLIPPPVKKKYSKDHIFLLLFIYYLKSFLSIGDIRSIVKPLIERFHAPDAEPSLQDIYRIVYQTELEHSTDVAKDIMKRYLQAEESFREFDLSKEDSDYLQFFSFICMLSFDVYVKKQIIENLIDTLPEHTADSKAEAKSKA